eukprot:IDg16784t1
MTAVNPSGDIRSSTPFLGVICEGISSTFGRLATSRLLTSSSSNICSSLSSVTSSFFQVPGWGVIIDWQEIPSCAEFRSRAPQVAYITA